MARSRSSSFSEDDLKIIGSQAISSQLADMSLNQTPSQSPARPLGLNSAAIDLTHSPATKAPTFGHPTLMHSQIKQQKKKESSMFYQPKNRPEHHRAVHRVAGPLAPKYEDKKPTPPQLYSSLPSLDAAPTYTPSAYNDVHFYTDPAKASADLKALLEGGMEEEDEDKVAHEGLEDGVLEGVKVKLLPHQVEGVEWMKGRELGPIKRGKLPKGGILADDMGLGKTLQSISLIISNPKPKHDEKGWKKHFDQVERATLVVAPLALIRQWETEIKEKVSNSHRLTVCVHHGPNRTKRFQDLARYDVVITTYQILVSEHGQCKDSVMAGCFGLHWYRVILDEAHSIKNRNAKATKACCALRSEYRWCLTGTPMQNNLDELQSLVNFLRITPYDNLSEWRAHIDAPMKSGKGHIAIRRLHSLLRCFMKRRTKEILKEEGALNPGGKKALEAAAKSGGPAAPAPAFKVTERKVITMSAEFSPAERQFYDRLAERADKSLEKMMKGKVNYANALVLLLRLRQACNHPRLVDGKLEKDKDALSTDTTTTVQPKAADDDLDALADAFGGMGIQTKQCDVCMSELSKDAAADGRAICDACAEDRAQFDQDSPERKRSKKKKVKKVVQEEVKVEVKKRKPRNRRAIIDSDDEEEAGSWLVPEDEQGSLHLGKAGGEEDENAEGGGDWINSDDSIHRSEDEDDGSRLSSFVVDDEGGADKSKADATADDDTFLSIAKVHSQVVEEKKRSQASASDTGSETEYESADEDTGVSESDIDSDDTGRFLHNKPGRLTSRVKGGSSASKHTMQSAKIRQLVEILHKEVHEHKFIVFSQFTSMLDLVEPFFRKEGFKFTRYDGGMKNDAREESLHRLRNDAGTRILLCSLKCGSLGLNLTAATRVVILEPFWNPFVEEQAIDRVHRLTQTVDVVVYRLTVAGTVEERILELQDKKRLLAEQAIEGGMRKKNALKLGLNEILDLFKHDGAAAGGGGGSRMDYYTGNVGTDGTAAVQDVGGVMSGMRRGGGVAVEKPKARDPVYDRRW
ncbi:uncharacterized protein E0L32_011430 [Thyridium curvatum]|uniref:Uncharacterized protein n=1 Tax=Thyridium curvatum TaxID=1093900 RepID=A0A507BPX5_9PEZI|nr:uncharacterized protein E0L32_011430 [Thyridium curvatum]TPX18878.1 hypothetical protein E0L32_011430 [Thyridium curvatum]